jgi:hypothetical protein
MVYGPAIAWSSSGRRGEDAARITQQIASVIEGWVRETPEQWLWLHRRWKTQPPSSRETPDPAGLSGSTVSRPAAPEPSSQGPPERLPGGLPDGPPESPRQGSPQRESP